MSDHDRDHDEQDRSRARAQAVDLHVETRPATLADWQRCHAVVQRHGRTFFFASRLLPSDRRRAMHAAYAFCRTADDIVDRGADTGRAAAGAALDAWGAQIDRPSHPVAIAFAAARGRYDVPSQPVRDLLDGVRLDLAPRWYSTWEDLRRYCYGVAGTVGLIAAPILGCEDASALPRAVSLGIAMQLTNILRDVAEDARMGRLYLPLEDLAAFGCDPEAVLGGRPSGRFGDLIAFEIARARALYDDARGGLNALPPTGQLTALASSHLYGKILTRIEEQGHDVFGPRACIPTKRKLRAMPMVAVAFLRLQLAPPARVRL